jgi:hypothetical protein
MLHTMQWVTFSGARATENGHARVVLVRGTFGFDPVVDIAHAAVPYQGQAYA